MIVLDPKELDKNVIQYVNRLKRQKLSKEDIDLRLDSYLKNNIVIKYSKEWQDNALNEMIKTILEVPGGYFQIQELMRMPHVEFEHYREKNRRSYEKNNVTDIMAKKELTPKSYKIYKFFKERNNWVDVNVEVEIPKHL